MPGQRELVMGSPPLAGVARGTPFLELRIPLTSDPSAGKMVAHQPLCSYIRTSQQGEGGLAKL